MSILEKLQSLPEKTRKIILWAAVAILAAGLLLWWLGNLKEGIAKLQTGGIFGDAELPNIEMPQISLPSSEELETIKEELNTINENAQEQESNPGQTQ